jgi:hypothetical protein
MTLTVLWGSFCPDGRWLPNWCLSLSAEEQYRQNVITNPALMLRHRWVR